MNYAILLAGGVGSRIKCSELPKQFIEINDKPIIVYTLESLLESCQFDYIQIGVKEDFTEYLNGLLIKYFNERQIANIGICNGGKERIDSISNCVKEIVKKFEINKEDIVLIHDAARPFITKKIILESISCAREKMACVAAIPVSDTLLKSDDCSIVSSIPNRREYFHGQSPDTFNLSLFINLYERLTENQRRVITGTSQICTMNNVPIHIVPGNSINFKITSDSDLIMARNILAEREKKNE